MENSETKTKTAKGANYAPFTLVVNFKPEYLLPNPNTGEVKTRWTYRCDLEAVKARANGKKLANDVDALGLIYKSCSHKYADAKMYANLKPVGQQLFLWVVQGKIIMPNTTEGLKRFSQWLKSL